MRRNETDGSKGNLKEVILTKCEQKVLENVITNKSIGLDALLIVNANTSSPLDKSGVIEIKSIKQKLEKVIYEVSVVASLMKEDMISEKLSTSLIGKIKEICSLTERLKFLMHESKDWLVIDIPVDEMIRDGIRKTKVLHPSLGEYLEENIVVAEGTIIYNGT